MKEITFIDLFGGIGGFRIGLENANRKNNLLEKTQEERDTKSRRNVSNTNGKPRTLWRSEPAPDFKCVGYYDINKYCTQVYNHQFKETHKTTDITTINAGDIPNHDLLCAGFPCQSFSIAGRRKGFQDTRGTLFFEICRILKEKRPRLCLLENVRGLLSADDGRCFHKILLSLDELGYDAEWQIFNTKYYLPQNRERVFIIGHLREDGGCPQEIFPIRQDDGFLGEEEQREQGEGKGIQGEDNVSTIDSRYRALRNAGETYIKELVYEGAIMSEKNKAWLNDGKELSRNFPQGQRVYSTKGLASSLCGNAGGLGGKTGLYAIPCLTPDRKEKRQHGRRFKEDGEEMFTLTGQDIHGVVVPVQIGQGKNSRAMKSGTCIGHRDEAYTVRSSNPNGVVLGSRIRRLTPLECERLQGFPDKWTEGVSDTQRYKMIGNAVSVPVITAIGREIINQLDYRVPPKKFAIPDICPECGKKVKHDLEYDCHCETCDFDFRDIWNFIENKPQDI